MLEGPSRSGKSTMISNALRIADNEDLVTVAWNKHPVTRPVIAQLKQSGLLDPLSFSLCHLLDFALTYRHVIVPALIGGRTVLSDRYVYTAWVRDRLRGLDEDLLRAALAQFIRPDHAFYLTATEGQIRQRYRAEPGKYDRYGMGRDLPCAPADPEESFVQYQMKQARLYEDLAVQGHLVLLDCPEWLADCLRHRG
ncbi:MAG TPA: hypothetical protein VF062_17060 [Candidatus Limnocylindrales bacterium]